MEGLRDMCKLCQIRVNVHKSQLLELIFAVHLFSPPDAWIGRCLDWSMPGLVDAWTGGHVASKPGGIDLQVAQASGG